MQERAWLAALNACQAANRSCVLVTVIALQGSLPRGVGTKMLVSERGCAGSIGGAEIEAEAVRIARRLLAEGGQLVSHTLSAGHADGDRSPRITLLFEPLPAIDFVIALFGAGHVGQALARVLAPLPCRLYWFDHRPGLFPEGLPANVVTRISERPQDEVGELPPDSYYLLVSPSHEQDFGIAAAALRRRDAAFVGMIGSDAKRAAALRHFEHHFAGERLAAGLTCPIGVDGISGHSPAEIAVAVAAQLLLLRDR